MDSTLAGRFQRAALGPRTLTAVVGIPLLLLAVWAGGLWWYGVTMAVALIGRMEFVRLHALGRSPSAATAVLIPAGWLLYFIAEHVGLSALMVVWAIVIAAVVAWHFAVREPEQRLRGFAAALVGSIYLAVPTGLLARGRLEFTPWSILAFLLVIWANDTAAYFVGLAAGRHKLAPRISPGKSWEGAVAGAVAGGLVGLVTSSWLDIRPGLGLIFGIMTTVASQVGDLFESSMKRKAGVKDSGTILPGHGGILDRFDGILVAAPIAYVLVRLWSTSP